MDKFKKVISGVLLTGCLALISLFLSGLIPKGLVDGTIFALVFGMLLNPILSKYEVFQDGINFSSKYILRIAIILMGLTLSFSQIVHIGGISIVVMIFTLLTSFVGGHFLGKAFGVNWRLSALISAGTGICGGSAIAAIAPVIEAEDTDIAYALSSTFIFDVAMVLLFPVMGKLLNMTDLGFGLWSGTSINDTSSVVAAGYAFSETAGAFAIIVKLTRTLSIIPTVIIFSIINAKVRSKETKSKVERNKIHWKDIFPYFILFFLVMVGVKSTGIISDEMSTMASSISKFCMIMALSAIGLKTSIGEVSSTGYKPMIFGISIDLIVTAVAYFTQMALGLL